jgi:magnesium transporter
MALPEIVESGVHIESVTQGKLRWVNIEKPTERETEYLANNYPFHPLDLDDCLSRIQRPKIDEYEDEGYLFMVFHFPVFSRQARFTHPSQVSVFLSANYLITLHQGELKPLVKLFRDCQINERAREEYMSRSSGYLLYHILDRLVNYCFPMLNKIGENIEAIEDDVFTKPVPKTVHRILVIKRDIISFRRIMRPQIAVLDSLEQREWSFLKGREDMEVYFGDIGDHLDKIWDMLEDYRELVDNLSEASNWLTSHRIQEVMRVLAVVAASATPFIIIASLYGMNVDLPLMDNPFAFVIMLLIMICLTGVMLFIFRRKRWI